MSSTLNLTRLRTESRSLWSHASDERLLLRYRDDGDMDAFNELVRRYERRLYNYLRRYLHDESLAEDVLQATLLQLHLKAQLYEPNRRFRPWLYAIATHQAIDLVRKLRRHRQMSLDATQVAGADKGALLNCLQSSMPSPVEQLEEKERREWVWRAVKRLPKHLRTVLVLRSYRGMGYRRVAEILQIPVGTVKTRVHTAKSMLNAAWRRIAC